MGSASRVVVLGATALAFVAVGGCAPTRHERGADQAAGADCSECGQADEAAALGESPAPDPACTGETGGESPCATSTALGNGTKPPAAPEQAKVLAEVLSEALADEYRSRAMYQAVIDRFGSIRPFSNIVQAEGRHAQALLNLFSARARDHRRGPVDAPHVGRRRQASDQHPRARYGGALGCVLPTHLELPAALFS